MLKSMIFAALSIAALQAAPAAAAVNFTISANNPVSFSANSTGFFFTFTAESAAATTLDIILTAYDNSDCYSPNGLGCAPYDRNRRAVSTIAISAGFAAYAGDISVGTGPGPIQSINVLFSTPSASPIVVTDFDAPSAGLVPEPSTWALMLAGFGMVGYAMRRRKLAFA